MYSKVYRLVLFINIVYGAEISALFLFCKHISFTKRSRDVHRRNIKSDYKNNEQIIVLEVFMINTVATFIKTVSIRKIFSNWIGKVITAAIAAAVIFGLLVSFNVIKINSSAQEQVEQRTWTVRRGDIELSIGGSGAAYSANREDVTSYVSGTVLKVHFRECSQVKKGDLLLEIDDSDAVLSLEKTENSIAQSALTLKDNKESIDRLVVMAPFSGKVTNVSVKKGDVVNRNGQVMTITDRSRMLLTLTFDNRNAQYIDEAQAVSVYIQSLNQIVEGTITRVDPVNSTSYEFGVEIEIVNPGLLEEGLKANASINTPAGEIWSMGTGTISFVNTQVIKSETGGVVKEVYVRDNQYVNSGAVLMVLEDDSLKITMQNNEIKLQELKSQLDYHKKQLGYYIVYAPIDGVIVSQSIKEGDVVKTGQVMLTVANNNKMELSIPIDELDIARIEEGMDVRVTVDALPETLREPLPGKVTKIALEGNSQGGVTTYPVTLTIENTVAMKGGMNANAQIIISNKQDILYIPIEAVQNFGGRSFVMVKGTQEGVNPDSSNGGVGGWDRRRNAQGNGSAENMGGTGVVRNSEGDGSTGNEGNIGAGRRNAGASEGSRTNSGGTGTMPRGFDGLRNQTTGYYDNAVPVEVEVGINNETYIEIVRGLNEGDQVILPQIVASQTQTQRSNGGMFPMGGLGGRTGGIGTGNSGTGGGRTR